MKSRECTWDVWVCILYIWMIKNIPIGSMALVFTYIWLICMVNVAQYIPVPWILHIYIYIYLSFTPKTSQRVHCVFKLVVFSGWNSILSQSTEETNLIELGSVAQYHSSEQDPVWSRCLFEEEPWRKFHLKQTRGHWWSNVWCWVFFWREVMDTHNWG